MKHHSDSTAPLQKVVLWKQTGKAHLQDAQGEVQVISIKFRGRAGGSLHLGNPTGTTGSGMQSSIAQSSEPGPGDRAPAPTQPLSPSAGPSLDLGVLV